MTPLANSYGTAAGVAALSMRYTNSGAYDATTNPTLSVVEGWINAVSAVANTYLAAAGFAIPVIQSDCVLALAGLINENVADLAHMANSAGRFTIDRAITERGYTPMRIIRGEIAQWVEDNAAGLEALGAARTLEDQRKNTLSAGVLSFGFAECGDGSSTVDE